MQGVKTEIMEDIDEKITKIVDNRTKELEERRRRELNIVVFNLEEGRKKTGKENKDFDE